MLALELWQFSAAGGVERFRVRWLVVERGSEDEGIFWDSEVWKGKAENV